MSLPFIQDKDGQTKSQWPFLDPSENTGFMGNCTLKSGHPGTSRDI